jgi:hypothetical protein
MRNLRFEEWETIYRATDAFARLTGKLDAAIDYGCPVTLAEVRADLVAARTALFNALHGEAAR